MVVMPPRGASARAHQLATLEGLAHSLAGAPEVGEWIEELGEAELSEVDRDLVRIAKRDWERARRVPSELAAERAEAGAAGQEAWVRAREQDDFASFLPALRRNIELARAVGQCVADGACSAYDALLSDYDYGLSTDHLRMLFGELGSRLPPIFAGAPQDHSTALHVPLDVQRQAVKGLLRRLGVERSSWRVDVSAHPFTAWMSPQDTRLTTRYEQDGLESLLSALHEYGHGLYERQIDAALHRTSLGEGTSMSMHESQSKLWENHVARSVPFAELIAAELADAGCAFTPQRVRSQLVRLTRSPIRVSADPVTYPLHIVLRFDLELALIAGELPAEELPAAWREGMRRLLGVEVSNDRIGCLQDVHWGAGSFGYFPSYALGCLIAAQLWEALERDLGSREQDLRRGELTSIQRWLAQHVHVHGRRLDTLALVEQATGEPLDVEPFMRYALALAKDGASPAP